MRIFVLLLLIGITFAHQCVHDEFLKDTPLQFVSEPSHTRTPRHMYRLKQFKIHADYSHLNWLRAARWKKRFIKYKLMPLAIEMLEKRLKVYSRTSNTRVGIHSCGREIEVPSKYRTRGFNGDLVIFVTAVNAPNKGFLAYAGACALDPNHDNRPIAGRVVFNLHYLKGKKHLFRNELSTTIHEITHVLAFSSALYKYYVDHNGNPRGKRRIVTTANIRGYRTYILKSPAVLYVTRHHFKCRRCRGAQLENQGGSGSLGSHWERTTLHNEYMTASDIQNPVISDFTFAILEDSGWYTPVWKYAEYLYWGLNQGCGFLRNACYARRHFPEFCQQPGAVGCTYDHRAIGVCSNRDPFADECAYVKPYSNRVCSDSRNNRYAQEAFGDHYGPHSKCVVSKGNFISRNYNGGRRNSAHCFDYECLGRKAKIYVGNTHVICYRGGQRKRVRGFRGHLVCPSIAALCFNSDNKCPNHCSGVGYCLNGTCECKIGFSGKACQRRL